MSITFSIRKSRIKRLRKEIGVALKLNNFRLYQIAQSLVWVSEGKQIGEIAKDFQVSERTIYKWAWRFALEGFSWLLGYHYKGRGRESKLTKKQKKELGGMIEAGPEANGFECGIWNTAMIAELIFRKFKINYNVRYLSSLLKKLGFSYQKAKFVSDQIDEEEYKKKRQEWKEKTWPKILKEAKEKGAVILFVDEVSFAMWGSLAYTWAKKGEQPVVKTTGIRKGLKMFGSIEFENGDFQYSERVAYSITNKSFKLLKEGGVSKEILARLKEIKKDKFNTEADFFSALRLTLGKKLFTQYKKQLLQSSEISARFNGPSYIDFLKHLLSHYSTPIILIEDSASYHTSKLVEQFKKEQKEKGRLFVHSLPTFSPDLNPIEKLWKNTKKAATHLKYFKTFKDLRESVVCAFRKFMQDASKVVCVMKKLRQDAALASI